MHKMKRLSLAALLLVSAAVVGQTNVKTDEKAPDFTLTDITGKTHSLADYKGKYVVLEWVNYGCPFVKKHYSVGNMQSLQKEWTAKDVVWLSICSSAKGKEGYLTAAAWKEAAEKQKAAATAILLDDSGKVGRLYGAKTTPHLFIVNPEGVVIYQGAIDNKPTADSGDVAGATNYVSQSLNEARGGKKVSSPTTTPYGCSVKYK